MGGGRRLRLAFAVLGAGVLLPWNAYVAAGDYFTAEYARYRPEFVFAVAYTGAMLVVAGGMMALGRALGGRGAGGAETPASDRHVVRGFIAFAAMALLTIAADLLPVVAFQAVSLLVLGTGVVDAFVQGSLYQVAASFSSRTDGFATNALQVGMSASGVFASVVRLATNLGAGGGGGGATAARASAYLYFGFSALCCASCALLHARVVRREHVKLRPHQAHAALPTTDEDERDEGERAGAEAAWRNEPDARSDSDSNGGWRWLPCSCRPPPHAQHLALVWMTYATTLAVFPGVTSQIAVTHAVGLVLAYNLSDCIGKWLSYFAGAHATAWLWALQPVRVANAASLVVLAAKYSRGDARSPPMTTWTAATSAAPWTLPLLSVSALGLGNGYVAGAAVMLAPMLYASPVQRERVGFATFVALITGLAIGALLGWALGALLL